MQKKVVLVVVVLAIVGSIVYLQNPAWLQIWLGKTSEQKTASGGTNNVVLGLLPNPEGDEVGLEVGRAAPDFALKTLSGGVIRLSDYRGKKAVIVNLWASWCPPCKLEMPDLEAAYQQHKTELVVLGVDLQEGVADIRKFLAEELSVTYPILLDDEGKVAAAYNKFTQPTSLLLDKAGIVRGRKNGAYTPEELQQRVQELLASSGSSTLPQGDVTPVKKGASSPPQLNGVVVESASAKVEPAAGVAYGWINEKYFGPGEIKQLGLEIDLKHVPYLSAINLDRLQLGCPVVDCIRSIDVPRFETAAEATWLADDDLVIGVAFNGVSKAYPTNILNWHEVVNDDFNSTSVVISYCPLCNSATAFVAPTLEGQVARFGVSGRLYNADLVMYDRVTKSMWSQIERRVIVGPLAGKSPTLDFVPLDMVPWGLWRAQHPRTQVLARPTTLDPQGGKPPRDSDPSKGRTTLDYSKDPYAPYKTNNYDTFGFPVTDKRLPSKTWVVGVEVSKASKAYPRDAVEAAKLINDELDGVPLALAFDPQSGAVAALRRPSQAALSVQDDALTDGTSRWDFDGTAIEADVALQPVLSLPSFWFAWVAFHPETALYQTSPGS